MNVPFINMTALGNSGFMQLKKSGGVCFVNIIKDYGDIVRRLA